MTTEAKAEGGIPVGERQRVAENPLLMRERLERFLQPAAGGPYAVRECRLASIRRRDGLRCSARYDLRLEEPATGRVWDEVVTGVIAAKGQSRRIWEKLRDAASAGGAAPSRSGLRPFGYLPDLDMLLQVFPHDYRLPALARLLEGPPPALLGPILAGFGEGAWELDRWTAQPVQYRVDMRAVVRMGITAREAESGRLEERWLYAKVYRDAEEGERGARSQRDLYDRVAGAGAGFAVAEPVAYAAELRTLVQWRVPGTTLLEILRAEADPLPAVRRAARAVAAFHRLDLVAPPRPFALEVARLAIAREVLRAGRPDLGGQVEETIAAVVAGLEGAPLGLVHGDLRADHVLLDGDDVALIDIDAMAAGDPIADVANFLTQLGKTRDVAGTPRDRAGTAARVFTEEYFGHVPAAWRARLPLHRALAGVTKAGGLYQRRVPGRQAMIDDLLREAHAAAVGTGA